ncbi:MAG: hypothetical protein J6W60_05805 [Treponema sp.]|nr:hypothetical protein [Treponema sp.]
MKFMRNCFVLLFALSLASCVSTPKNSFTTPVPEQVGMNELAGKAFVSETGKYEFNEDGTAVYSQMNYSSSRYTKTALYAYSCDSETKTLYMARRGYYVDDVLYTNLDDFMNAEYTTNYDDDYCALQKKRYMIDSELVQQYVYTFDKDKASIVTKMGTTLTEQSMGFLYSPESTNGIYLFSMIWYNGGLSTGNYDINDGGKSYMGTTEAMIVLTDATDSTAKVAYTYNGEILGYGRMEYKIDKRSDTKGSITVSFHDIDQAVIDFYESRVKELKKSTVYRFNEPALKIGAFINSEPLTLESISPTEYDVEE